MQTDEDQYKHILVHGLPRSLNQVESGTVAVIALMQRQAGLNRERKREMQSGAKSPGQIDEALSRAISKTDRNILSFYHSGRERWGSFWSVIRKYLRQQNSTGTKAYAIAVDFQLLNAYHPEWRKLAIEIDALTEACSEWERIRERLERFWKPGGKEQMPLDVFMLWPRLIADMQRWEELGADRRTQVGHAVFSLSSIGATRWFIDEAISICPDLEIELGALTAPATRRARAESGFEESQPSISDQPRADESRANSAFDIASAWEMLGEDLTLLQNEWQPTATRALLGRLISLGNNAAQLLAALPDDIAPPHILLEQRLRALRHFLQEAANREELCWLSTDDQNSIMARWDLELGEVRDDDSILQLADDAELAKDRLVTAIGEMQIAQAEVDRTKQIVTVLDEELTRLVSGIRRVELTNQQLRAKEEVLAAERKQNEVVLQVLASASPRAEVFDPKIDYAAEAAAQLQGKLYPLELTESDDQGVVGHSLDASRIADVIDATEQEVSNCHDSEPAAALRKASATENHGQAHVGPLTDTMNPCIDQVQRVDAVKSDIVVDKTPESVQPSKTEVTIRETDFSSAAGDRCRPIWSLLEMGRPSLAYQFARALLVTFPQLRVPPLALLRSVALAPGLIAGDGPLAISIGEAFAEIDQKWFEPEDMPSNWHTALNLLLIAATLRPMVLAPAMGAATIASYRHLDGRYSALLDLVRQVGEASEPLTAFVMGPTMLRSAADEVSQKAQLTKLSDDAEDWLIARAPSKKIRYAPASKVWMHWLKPGEAIHKLIWPVAQGAVSERNAIRALADALLDYDAFFERVRDTDRRQLGRRGPDIEAGALEHLWIATCEAVALAKEWLAAENMLSESGGRLRTLIGKMQTAFYNHASQACNELSVPRGDDQWGQVEAASRVLSMEIQSIASMFKQSDAIPTVEMQAKELLARDVLLVPEISIAEDWVVESDDAVLLRSLESWIESPIDAATAFNVRIQNGDLAGAGLLLQHWPINNEESDRQQEIDKARDQWVRDLQQKIQQARRASEVGLAYGYLSDTERAACEGELSAMELSQRETDRFDQTMLRVQTVIRKIDEQKIHRIQEALDEFDREKSGLSKEVAEQVRAPLDRSDIHTFNELMQRVRQGMEPWPERDLRRDAFREFFPGLQTELLGQLVQLGPAEVDKKIRQGDAVGQLAFDLEGDEQARADAEEVYRAWASSCARRNMTRESVRKILEALGMPVRELDQAGSVAGCWSLRATPVVDRDVCPVPYFGSRAQGRYRVIVLTDRLTPEDFLQRIGETSQQIATIVFILSRNPSRFWPELARLSKERHRSFLLLDESILLFLLAQRGSRLTTWFDIALPFTYSEPYDASAGFVPPEMFYGRASELEAVKAQGGCYFIYGGRQLGKTALLRRAEKTFHDPLADRYAVWIDLLAQGIGERRPAADVWLSVFDKLRELNIADLELPVVGPGKSVSIDTVLTSIKMFLAAKPGRRILLLLDEADRFLEQDARQGGAYAETRRLKQLMDESDRQFKVVFAGLHNVLRTANTSNQPLGHFNEAIRIGPLMDEREIRAAEELITRPVEAAGFEFDDRRLVMRVLAQTNYYPSLIQLYCTQLLRHLRETKLKRRDVAGPRFKIQEADIESVFSGRPLRDAIRSKFRLTLQLDDRYEVIAHAIGLEALSPGYDHSQGIDWRTIRQDCATSWWPEGFAATSERDFIALLDEMVQLGVLSQSKTPERFSLRNPNVLLLLGSKQEIESTLQVEREPRIEFEPTIFRPTLMDRVDDPARNPLTYRQLDEVVQMRSTVSLVAASEASGIGNILSGLRDRPGMASNGYFVSLDRASDKKGFVQELDKESKRRVADGTTVMLVPQTVPWNIEWVTIAQDKVKSLTSTRSFVSVVFVADPRRLWTLSATLSEQRNELWLSVLPWKRGFVRKWLEELQLTMDAVDRLETLTGFWGGLLESAARVKGGQLDFMNNLDQIAGLLNNPEWRRENLRRLTGGIDEAEAILFVLYELGDGVSESDLVEFGGLRNDVVKYALRWAELLGLAMRQSGDTWALDPFVKCMFGGVNQ